MKELLKTYCSGCGEDIKEVQWRVSICIMFCGEKCFTKGQDGISKSYISSGHLDSDEYEEE